MDVSVAVLVGVVDGVRVAVGVPVGVAVFVGVGGWAASSYAPMSQMGEPSPFPSAGRE